MARRKDGKEAIAVLPFSHFAPASLTICRGTRVPLGFLTSVLAAQIFVAYCVLHALLY